MLDRFPAAGTKCQDCGCCQAAIFAGGAPLCWECDEGKPCKGKLPSPPPTVSERVEQAAVAVEQQILKTGKKLGLAAQKTDRKTEAWASVTGYPVSDALKARILQADPGISHQRLAIRLGTSGDAVAKVRAEAGIGTPITRHNPRKAAAMLDPEEEKSLREKFDHDEPEVQGPEPAPVTSETTRELSTPHASITHEMGDEQPRPSANPFTPALIDHYSVVIADLEEKAAYLERELEIITCTLLPILRKQRDSKSQHLSTATQPAHQETNNV